MALSLTMLCFGATVLLLFITGVGPWCSRLPDVPNATPDTVSRTGKYTDGEMVKHSCEDGYEEHGTSATYTCRANSWEGGDSDCKLKMCSTLDPPENGRITNSPNFAAGSSVSFSCNTGYEMSGESALNCTTDGQWKPASPPTCQVKTCPDFGTIANAKIFKEVTGTVKNSYGNINRVVCNRDYVLVGKNLVKCLETEQWEELPSCKPLTGKCPPIPGANSSCIDTSVFYPSGSLLVLECKDDSAKVSVTRLGAPGMDTFCQNGAWTQNDTACYCDCLMNRSAPYISMNKLSKFKFLKHRETLSWNCSGGATKATDEDVVCWDGRLSAEPVCTHPNPTITQGSKMPKPCSEPVYSPETSFSTPTTPASMTTQLDSKPVHVPTTGFSTPTSTESFHPCSDNGWWKYLISVIGGIFVGVLLRLVPFVSCYCNYYCREKLGNYCQNQRHGRCNWIWDRFRNSRPCNDDVEIALLEIKVSVIAGQKLWLECPEKSPKGTVVWEGPPNFTVYISNGCINAKLPEEIGSRVSINNDHDLKIEHAKISDGGSFRCIISGKVYEWKVQVVTYIERETNPVPRCSKTVEKCDKKGINPEQEIQTVNPTESDVSVHMQASEEKCQNVHPTEDMPTPDMPRSQTLNLGMERLTRSESHGASDSFESRSGN